MYVTSRRGFTLIELLIVIAIISILIALVTIAAGMMLQRAKSTKDMGNHRTIGQATFSHATDNNGKLLHPRTGPLVEEDDDDAEESTPSQIERMWIAAYGQDVNGDDRLLDLSNGEYYIEMKSALEEGAAFQYIGDVMAYQSPLDPSIGDVSMFVAGGNIPTDRIRSYSLNAFVGVQYGADDFSEFRDALPLNLEERGYWKSTETLSQIPQPAGTMCSIGEDDRLGRNGHGWLVAPTNYINLQRNWIDFPAFWDDRRVNISFVDGSTGSIALESDLLKKHWLEDCKNGHNHFNIQDCKVEYKRFHRILLPGVIGSVLD